LGKIPQPRLPNSWTLVELALVLPVLFATAAVLFQFGILFIAYLSLVHEMRDIGRYAAVHPNTIDTCVTPTSSATCTNAVSGSLFRRACDDLPSPTPTQANPNPTYTPTVYTVGRMTMPFTPCAAASAPCTHYARDKGESVYVEMSYDASSEDAPRSGPRSVPPEERVATKSASRSEKKSLDPSRVTADNLNASQLRKAFSPQ
jgi:hypothetical protein